MYIKPFYRGFFLGLLGIILAGILYFGLKPDKLVFTNGVEWLKHSTGVRFKD